ncbi:HNH endonuclease signature motif containing protein [Nocardioides sp. NPDC047086]|uniref:HNH endonuclease signature motif containing protein n=1 Tax=Nocardioides sp. NPDC047086 TaxID=3154810 RepID=UPI0033F48F3D
MIQPSRRPPDRETDRNETQGESDCDAPAAWTEAHHLKPWSEGGRTNLANMVLLCPSDHRRIHDPNYTHERLPDGRIRFTRGAQTG